MATITAHIRDRVNAHVYQNYGFVTPADPALINRPLLSTNYTLK